LIEVADFGRNRLPQSTRIRPWRARFQRQCFVAHCQHQSLIGPSCWRRCRRWS